MNVIKSTEKYNLNSEKEVIVTQSGAVTQILATAKHAGVGIIKVDKDHYFCPREGTGEVHEFNHTHSRQEDYKSVKRSLERLRNYINANVDDINCCKWVTLTYAENMTDPVRLYQDFRKFNAKLKRWEDRNLGYTHEYIIACEPQGRGAWHIHALFIYPQKVPFIPNKIIAEKWGHGYTKTKKLDQNIDNLGAYLSAYMTNMPVDAEGGSKKSKQFVKGARLRFYPPGFNIFRCSRGIKKPVVKKMTYAEALRLVEGHTKTFESTFFLEDEGEPSDNSQKIVVHKEFFNSKRKSTTEPKKPLSEPNKPSGAEIKVTSGELSGAKRWNPSPDH